MPTVDKAVAVGADDGHIDDGAFFSTSTSMWAGLYADETRGEFMWMRFATLGIPTGASITAAYITLRFETHPTTDPPTGDSVGAWWAHDADDPAAFTSITDWNNRVKTTNTVGWTLDNVWANDTAQQTPSLTAIIQELVDSFGGIEACILFWEPSTTPADGDEWQFEAFDGAGTNQAVLHVEYTTGAAAPVREAIHVHKRITAQTAESTTTLTTKLTITAAELTTAGFVANDAVLVLCFLVLASNSTTAEAQWRITYNSVALHPVTYQYDFGATLIERGCLGMYRVSLGGTVTDIDIDLASNTAATNVFIEKAELLVIRLRDFGVEGVNWVWNEATSDTTHATGPGTWTTGGQGSITFTPAIAEDWIIIGSVDTEIDSTSVNHRYRINQDSGAAFLGVSSSTVTPTEEGESTAEAKVWTMIDMVNLSAASHTIANQVEDDTTGANDNRRSAIFAFQKSRWPDLFIHENGDVTMTTSTDTQIATITGTLSAAQNVAMIGYGHTSIVPLAMSLHMWIRQGGTTIIDPVIDDGSGLQIAEAYDATDELLSAMLAYKNITAGALDLDLFAWQNSGGDETMHKSTLLVWGMKTAAGVKLYPPYPPRQSVLIRM
jgi:hypothetical protein